MVNSHIVVVNLTTALNTVPVERLSAGGALVWLLVRVDDLVAAQRRRLAEPLPAHLADEGPGTWTFEIDQLELKMVLFDSSTNSVLHVLCCPKNVIKGCANSFMQPLTLTRPRLHKLALRGKREPECRDHRIDIFA